MNSKQRRRFIRKNKNAVVATAVSLALSDSRRLRDEAHYIGDVLRTNDTVNQARNMRYFLK